MHFINLSLSHGCLSIDWKLNNITIKRRRGSRSNVKNYQPISLTCILCKVLESIRGDKITHS